MFGFLSVLLARGGINQQWKDTQVDTAAETFAQIIGISTSTEDIKKNRSEMKGAGNT
jgi:hypothetical protein